LTLETPDSGSKHVLGVDMKVLIAVAVALALCFVALVGSQSLRQRDYFRMLMLDQDIKATERLARQIGHGVRLRNAALINAAFRQFADNRGSGVVALVAADSFGQLLQTYRSPQFQNSDIGEQRTIAMPPGTVDELARSQLTISEGTYTVKTPVPAGSGQGHAGMLVAVWSLEDLDRMLIGNLWGQAQLAGFTVLLLSTVLTYLHRRLVTRPLILLNDVIRAVSRGNKSIAIPSINRKDEVGDLARNAQRFQQTVAMVDRLTAEQQQHRAHLAKALEKERQYNSLQREFVAMASHEFRTPLTIIDGTAQRVVRRENRLRDGEIRERMEAIRREVQRLTDLMDSTLNVGRIDAGTLRMMPSHCDLAAILRSVCARQEKISRNLQISLNLEQAPSSLWADPGHLDNIFTNLVSNAAKYSPNDPRIEVAVTRDDGCVVVSVRDFGLGIPADELSKLFQKYFRASTSEGLAGTGIGLHLVKHLVELHGGSLTVESEVGRGSVFRVRLPIGPATAASLEGARPAAAAHGPSQRTESHAHSETLADAALSRAH